MPYRGTICRALLISAFAATAFAQTPPPEVDQALRARVTQFFQYHVEGNFRKAYEMVAEDTKDFYFAAMKIQFKSFQITGVKYSDNFTKATVDLNTDQEIRRPEFPSTIVPIPMSTFWKIEDGKWVWHRDADAEHITPMGPSDVASIRSNAKISPQDLRKIVDPDSLQQMAANIMHQSGVDKTEVTFATDKPSTVVVSFHNGQEGTVKVTIAGGKSLAGFSAALDKTDLGPNENAVLKMTYDPSAATAPMPPQATVRLVVEPFHQVFDVALTFTAANH
jgi:hypothetical protein